MRPLVAGLIAALAAAALSSAAEAQDPYGTYVRPSTGTEVEFYNCGGKLCGKVTKVRDASKQANVGKVILNGATKAGDNKWQGDLLNLEDGKTYSGHVTVLGPQQIKLEGCALAVICKGETWNKVK